MCMCMCKTALSKLHNLKAFVANHCLDTSPKILNTYHIHAKLCHMAKGTLTVEPLCLMLKQVGADKNTVIEEYCVLKYCH